MDETQICVIDLDGAVLAGVEPGFEGVAERVRCAASDQGVAVSFCGLEDVAGNDLGPVAGADITPTHWASIASQIERNYQSYDGFVVVQGSDTLAYTASALSFVLGNLAKAVVVTGAVRGTAGPRSDQVDSLLNCVRVAAGERLGLPALSEVVVCFGGRILRGNRTRKVSSGSPVTFDSPAQPPLGRIEEVISLDVNRLRPRPAVGTRLALRPILDGGIASVVLLPGYDHRVLDTLLTSDEVKGMVLQTFGAGSVPTQGGIFQDLASSTANGKVVVTVGHSPLADPASFVMDTGNASLIEAGVIPATDITPEAAMTKLAVALASASSPEEARALFARDLCGEQSATFEVGGGLVAPDGSPLGDEARGEVLVDVRGVTDALMAHLLADPRRLHSITPRKFEEIVAELLADRGYDVTLTAPSGDGGHDIFAAQRTDLGSFLYLVECKRWAPDRPVGVEVVRNLYGVVAAAQATAGIVVTTSRFTRGAHEYQGRIERRMTLREYGDLTKWLSDYKRPGPRQPLA